MDLCRRSYLNLFACLILFLSVTVKNFNDLFACHLKLDKEKLQYKEKLQAELKASNRWIKAEGRKVLKAAECCFKKKKKKKSEHHFLS